MEKSGYFPILALNSGLNRASWQSKKCFSFKELQETFSLSIVV